MVQGGKIDGSNSAPVVGAINPPDGHTIVMFAIAATIPNVPVTSTFPTGQNLLLFCTQTLQKAFISNGFIYAKINEYGTNISFYTDAGYTAWIGSFKMSGLNRVAVIQWNAQNDSTKEIIGGSLNIIAQATKAISGDSFFAVRMGGQEVITTLSSQQQGYDIYDIYLKHKPKNMTLGTLNQTIDLSSYSYNPPSDGPIFGISSSDCSDIAKNNSCANCYFDAKFLIDNVPVPLRGEIEINSVRYIRIHVGQAPATAPLLSVRLPTLLSSQQNGYYVHDVYMADIPKTMKVGGVIGRTIDISKYSYATLSDGPIFGFTSATCFDLPSKTNGCINCVTWDTEFMIDNFFI